MPPSKPLPSAILSALGLASTGCGIFGPCLDYAVCLDYVTYPTGDTGPDTGVGPCLDYSTGGSNPSTVEPVNPVPRAPAPPRAAELLEAMAAEGTLPDDVLERLGARREAPDEDVPQD